MTALEQSKDVAELELKPGHLLQSHTLPLRTM